jgi:hypothetical protein
MKKYYYYLMAVSLVAGFYLMVVAVYTALTH